MATDSDSKISSIPADPRITPELLSKLLQRCTEVGICTECGGNIIHDVDEPFASCDGCGYHGEWYKIPTLQQLQMDVRKAERLAGRKPTNLTMTSLFSEEGGGSYGAFAMEIIAGATKMPNLEDERIRRAVYEAAKLVKEAVLEAIVRENPAAQAHAKNEREALLSCFPNRLNYREIPNGYNNDWSNKLRPWFEVFTAAGMFTIGVRGSVLHLSWEHVPNSPTAKALFPDEKVTMGERMIHCYGFEDASRYVAAILRAVPLYQPISNIPPSLR